jgi:hypothetical protein
MSTLAKVTLGLVSIAALCFFYLAARTLKTHDAWRSSVNSHEKAIENVEKKTTTLIAGNPDQNQPSMAQLEVALHSTLTGRGRVWRNVNHRMNQNAVVATIDLPDPHKIEAGAVLYAFEMSPDQPTARYMGEFKATQVAGKDVQLEPTVSLFPFQVERITQSRAPWALYEVVPADGHEIFAGLSDADLAAILPKAPPRLQDETDEEYQRRLAEYQLLVRGFAKDGQVAEANDPAERVEVSVKVTKNYDQLDQQAKLALEQLQMPPELIKEGQVLKFEKATADQPDAADTFEKLQIGQVVDRRYKRKLIDFSMVLRNMARELPLLVDRLAAATDENNSMKAALADAQKHEAFNQDEIVQLKTERDQMQNEAKLVVEYRTSLEEKLQTVQSRIDELLARNQQLADQLAQAQLDAVGLSGRQTAQARLEPAR